MNPRGKYTAEMQKNKEGKHCLCLNTDNAFLQEGKKIPVLLPEKTLQCNLKVKQFPVIIKANM